MAISTGYQESNTEGGQAFEHGKRMVEEARAFTSAVGQGATSFSRAIDLKGRVQRNPIAMVAAAAGVGYVIGGGLFSPVTARLLKVGVRLALIPFIKSQLTMMVGNAASGRVHESTTF